LHAPRCAHEGIGDGVRAGSAPIAAGARSGQSASIRTIRPPKTLNGYMRDKHQRNRDLVFAHYGEQCACCGESERLFLTIDHINNDGAAPAQSCRSDREWWQHLLRLARPERLPGRIPEPVPELQLGQARQRRRVPPSR
jgi:hypothetical protein